MTAVKILIEYIENRICELSKINTCDAENIVKEYIAVTQDDVGFVLSVNIDAEDIYCCFHCADEEIQESYLQEFTNFCQYSVRYHNHKIDESDKNISKILDTIQKINKLKKCHSCGSFALDFEICLACRIKSALTTDNIITNGSDSDSDDECAICQSSIYDNMSKMKYITQCCKKPFHSQCIKRILREHKPCPLCRRENFEIQRP